jgi:hypothetical protein
MKIQANRGGGGCQTAPANFDPDEAGADWRDALHLLARVDRLQRVRFCLISATTAGDNQEARRSKFGNDVIENDEPRPVGFIE